MDLTHSKCFNYELADSYSNKLQNMSLYINWQYLNLESSTESQKQSKIGQIQPFRQTYSISQKPTHIMMIQEFSLLNFLSFCSQVRCRYPQQYYNYKWGFYLPQKSISSSTFFIIFYQVVLISYIWCEVFVSLVPNIIQVILILILILRHMFDERIVMLLALIVSFFVYLELKTRNQTD